MTWKQQTARCVKNAWPLTTQMLSFADVVANHYRRTHRRLHLRRSDISSYGASGELPEPPRNALDELMHLGFGGLIGFGIRFGCVLAIVEIIALVVLVIILIVFAVVLTLLGVGIGNLFFGNLTSLAGV